MTAATTQGTLDKALEMVDYEGFRQQQAQARQQGRYLGIGLSTYVEVCGLAPSKAAGAMGFQGGLWEPATVRVLATGKVVVLTGTNPHGQGEETTFAQLVGEELGVPVEDVDVVHGDTGAIPMGWGTYGSRTTAVGGTAICKAAHEGASRRPRSSRRTCWRPRRRTSSSTTAASTWRAARRRRRRSRTSR